MNTTLPGDLTSIRRLLNGLMGAHFEWETPTAQKRHSDEFGDVIEVGEMYLKRSIGTAYDQVVKLSQRSAQKILHSLLEFNPAGRALVEGLAAERERRFRDSLRRGGDALSASTNSQT